MIDSRDAWLMLAAVFAAILLALLAMVLFGPL
jgi:hypothetical protein